MLQTPRPPALCHFVQKLHMPCLCGHHAVQAMALMPHVVKHIHSQDTVLPLPFPQAGFVIVMASLLECENITNTVCNAQFLNAIFLTITYLVCTVMHIL